MNATIANHPTVIAGRYAVMGNPIAHSRSPFIHRLFAAQSGCDIDYRALSVEPDGLAAAIETFISAGGRGLNITLPFKEEAFALSSKRTSRAERAGAVNTLSFEEGDIHGDNTDGIGLVRDLVDRIGVKIEGASVLLLGAGGAARGAVGPILDRNPIRLTIANRSVDRAVALADRFAGQSFANQGSPVDALSLEDLSRRFGSGPGRKEGFDLVINATAASLGGDLPALPDGIMGKNAVAYDMAYSSKPTPFVEWGQRQGAAIAIDGLGMLVEQAAESYRIWLGISPRTSEVIEELRHLLAD
ncbi:shikimate dehydrogenase [Thioalkalivibrio sp. HK1]|uniref:shikimate dehydrogenase n=1 Tax=Thioalkalivibrio sp. HK1 TaxID=1469245 RepID=UPI000688191E|nr:shikimate dehydrogenase [Thioalkalivibrio sp. HK1]